MSKQIKKSGAKHSVVPDSPGGSCQNTIHYKVIELSQVDESALERTLNEWVKYGWNFDGVQFAMRESSRRPSMAFMFFTRAVEISKNDQSDALNATEYSLTQTPSEALVHPYRRLHKLADVEDADE